jgi:hypothetical protein
MSRSCTSSGHGGQRAYSYLVETEGLCTNALDHRYLIHDRDGKYCPAFDDLLRDRKSVV